MLTFSINLSIPSGTLAIICTLYHLQKVLRGEEWWKRWISPLSKYNSLTHTKHCAQNTVLIWFLHKATCCKYSSVQYNTGKYNTIQGGQTVRQWKSLQRKSLNSKAPTVEVSDHGGLNRTFDWSLVGLNSKTHSEKLLTMCQCKKRAFDWSPVRLQLFPVGWNIVELASIGQDKCVIGKQ